VSVGRHTVDTLSFLPSFPLAPYLLPRGTFCRASVFWNLTTWILVSLPITFLTFVLPLFPLPYTA